MGPRELAFAVYCAASLAACIYWIRLCANGKDDLLKCGLVIVFAPFFGAVLLPVLIVNFIGWLVTIGKR